MSFRRLPFQFTTTDPVERQRELERRFGLSSSRNMFVDGVNPLSAGSVSREPSISSSSPRLQHRVPIFVEGYDQPIQSSVDSTGSTSENKKSNVRVIPIEIEGAESRPTTTRHRTFSGPAIINNECNDEYMSQANDTSLKRSMADLSKPLRIKTTSGPRVHNIPIKVENANSTTKIPKFEKLTKNSKKDCPKGNGCTVSKPLKVKSPDKENKCKSETNKGQNADIEQHKIGVENSLKKIENVLDELKTYEAEVQEFSGTTKDKQYRYLDEMLTRCMLKLDDVDTMGNENLRSARKRAVKKIQMSIDLLESKSSAVNRMETTSVSGNEGKTVEMQETTLVESSEESKISSQNEVEMTEEQDVESEITEDKQENIEVETIADTAANINNDEITVKSTEDQAGTEKPNEVPEVEMSEIKEDSTTQELNSEIIEFPEVEMTDFNKSILSNVESYNKIPVQEIVAKTTSVQPSNIISQENIEMQDVHSMLQDAKENIVECDSSQLEGTLETDVNMEANTSTDNGEEITAVSNSNAETFPNETCDSDINEK